MGELAAEWRVNCSPPIFEVPSSEFLIGYTPFDLRVSSLHENDGDERGPWL